VLIILYNLLIDYNDTLLILYQSKKNLFSKVSWNKNFTQRGGIKVDFFAGSTLDLHDPLLAWLGSLVENHINSYPTFYAQCNPKQGCIFT